jgi:hypothetical protein
LAAGASGVFPRLFNVFFAIENLCLYAFSCLRLYFFPNSRQPNAAKLGYQRLDLCGWGALARQLPEKLISPNATVSLSMACNRGKPSVVSSDNT